MKFSEMPYRRPDVPALLKELGEQAEKARQAESGAALVKVYEETDRAVEEYTTLRELASIRYTIDTRDLFYSGEHDYFDQQEPEVENASIEFAKAVLSNPHRQALTVRHGDMLLRKLEVQAKSADERVLELMQQENALGTEYERLYASAQIPFQGETLTVAQLAPRLLDADRAVRRAAYEAEGNWFDANREQFDRIYDDLVKNLNRQARILGYDNYVDLSYLRMGRIGYGRAEVEAFRKQVAEDVVPLAAEIQARRFRRLGIDSPRFYDTGLAFAGGNPVPIGTTPELLDKAVQMYHELSPETAEFVDFMTENDLFDLEAKPGKAPGGYMTSLRSYRAPFIFSNANGTSDDVDTLTHEFGHAFQGYVAMRSGLPGQLQEAGMESCEIHSMSMEFLTSPWHHLFFGPDTGRYQLAHAEEALLFLPYGCMVDEFQHIVYENENLTPDQRNQAWLDLERKYRPWNDFDGLPFYSRGGHWQWKMHIYTSPFYYIDYCLAQSVALQFFAAHLHDPADAWKRYLALVRQGGAKSYAGLVEAAGFQVPFQSGALAPVARTVADWCAAQQI